MATGTKLIEKHFLPISGSGAAKFINTIHYGSRASGRKMYIQAGLHADEAPGYMVMHYLLEMLDAADAEGRIDSEIVCVPAANPIGFDQWFQDRLMGRFDTANGINFNRNHHDLIEGTAALIDGKLTQDAGSNRNTIREAMREVIEKIVADDESSSLKKLLIQLSFDSDIVLDLHCDNQALLHIYTGTPLWPDAEDLAAWVGADAVLLAEESGGDPYDEACSKIWWKLKERYPDFPIEPSCLSATVEFRGEADVSSVLNRMDAANIYCFMHQRGYMKGDLPLCVNDALSCGKADCGEITSSEICGKDGNSRLNIPACRCVATPLSGVEHIRSTVPGIASFCRRPGDMVKAGDKIGEVMNPFADGCENRITELFCRADGLLFSLTSDRMVRPGRILAKIAGSKPIEGKGKQLLTA